jgi:hypothetical protein
MPPRDRLSLEDRLDIQELFARYCWGLNTGNLEQVQSCFAPDGYLHHPPQGRCQGPDGIKRLLDELWYDRPEPYVARQHLANHLMLTPEGDGVRARGYWTVVRRDIRTDQCLVHSLGDWNNRCVSREAVWLFESVVVTPWKRDTTPWIGEERAYRGRAEVAAPAPA